VLLLEFASYIWFFYYTHTQTEAGEVQIPDTKQALIASGLLPASFSTPDAIKLNENSLKELRATAQEARLKNDQKELKNDQKERYGIYANISILICSTVALVFASIYLLEAVSAPSKILQLSESFVGLVIIPSILATVDHIAAVFRSQKEGIAWIIETALGSSIRISLFVFPLAVIFGWALGVETGMILDGFQVTVLGLAILLVNHVIHNGFAHW
jgi:Ca2+:H+ antiporter